MTIWGNHSSTQFPDVSSATVTRDGKEQGVYEAVANDTWLKGDFVQVQGVVCCGEGGRQEGGRYRGRQWIS